MKPQTAKWVRKAEADIGLAREAAAANPPYRDGACFHCQQAAEKYLKALLQEFGAAVPRTHDLEDLVDLLLPRDATLAAIRRGLATLTRYAVDYRYPSANATTRQMLSALRKAGQVRTEIRTRLGLPL